MSDALTFTLLALAWLDLGPGTIASLVFVTVMFMALAFRAE